MHERVLRSANSKSVPTVKSSLRPAVAEPPAPRYEPRDRCHHTFVGLDAEFFFPVFGIFIFLPLPIWPFFPELQKARSYTTSRIRCTAQCTKLDALLSLLTSEQGGGRFPESALTFGDASGAEPSLRLYRTH